MWSRKKNECEKNQDIKKARNLLKESSELISRKVEEQDRLLRYLKDVKGAA